MYEELERIVPEENLCFNEPMKNHTSFQIGGPADVMVFPTESQQLKAVVAFCVAQGIPFLVTGNGSNLLVRDGGIRGVVIKLGENFKQLSLRGETIEAQAGIRLSELCPKVAVAGLSGLEFAEGIPGTLGGAVYMNAGAYDGEMKNVVQTVEAMDNDGCFRTYTNSEMGFGYRKSLFQDRGLIIVTVSLGLKKGNPEKIMARMQELAELRRNKQPLEYPSAGSVFRRPQGYYVGPMIEKLGLKGYRIGGAKISRKHAGFIVNVGEATAGDVLALVALVQEKARQEFGVELQPEIRIVGEE